MREHRAVAWLGPALHHPRVWHVSRRGIALGAAIGVFFGLLIPLGQIVFAAVLAVLLRANLPAAALTTLVTNPFTVAPIYFAAYRLGQALLGGDVTLTEEAIARTLEVETGGLRLWLERAITVGRPLFLGLLIVAVAAAGATYVAIDQTWRMMALSAWRRRRGPRQD